MSKFCIIDPNSPYTKGKKLISVVFLFHNKSILMQHRDNKRDIVNPNMWGPPGGHCDKGETPHACAIREVKEEANYLCSNLRFYRCILTPYKNEQSLLCSFWDIYDKVQKIECFEGQSISFVSFSRLNKLNIAEHIRAIIQDIKKLI